MTPTLQSYLKKKIESNLWVYMSRYYTRSWTLKCNIIRALLDKCTEYYDNHPTQPAEVQNSFPQNMTNWFLKDEYEEDIGKTYTHRYETVPRVRRNSMLLECKIWSQKWLSYKAIETKRLHTVCWETLYAVGQWFRISKKPQFILRQNQV